jgi:cytochrome d ubiquinol oxidase subunit I
LVGLDQFAKEDRPNTKWVFYSFRVMVAIGMGMIAIGLFSLFLRWRKKLYDNRFLLKTAVWFAPSGIVATIAGWIVTEVGRQPYTVYGLLRTYDSHSPLDAPAVAASLAIFVIVYLLVFGAGIVYTLRLMSVRPGERGELSDEESKVKSSVTLSNRLPHEASDRKSEGEEDKS